MAKETYIPIGEAAAQLQVSRTTLRRWDRDGKLPAERHPQTGHRQYARSLLQAWQAKQPTSPQAPDTAIMVQTQLGRLVQQDAFDFLRAQADASAMLLFADPPYNIRKAEWDTFPSQQAYVDWSMRWIREARRVLHPRGSLFICGFSEILADLKWAAAPLFAGCKWLVWYYRNKANLGHDWGRAHESILHFRKSRDFQFFQDPVRIPYNAHTLKYPDHPQAASSQYGKGKAPYQWQPHPLGAKPKDVFEIPTLSNHSWERTDHPTQKPSELLRRILLSTTLENDLVLDPFAGSGTTLLVAESLGRRWLGSELEASYGQLLANRIHDQELLDRIRQGADGPQAAARRAKLR